MIDNTEAGAGLKVIGAGFGRTGTLSLKAALETLGFGPCYHMIEVFQHPDDLAYWEAATREEPVDWQALFARYQATVDWPACAFYEELLNVYPDAKVLLTVRDPERWYESAFSTIYGNRRMARSRLAPLLFLMMRISSPDRMRVGEMINALIWKKTFDDRFEDKEHALKVFAEHIEEVKQRIPPDRLLVFNVKEGWKPLCAFLGVEVPVDTPFPHLNERADFMGNRMRLVARMRLIMVASAIGVLAVLLVLLRLVRRAGAQQEE